MTLKNLCPLRPFAGLLAACLCARLASAAPTDVNITNITRASSVPALTDEVLGITNGASGPKSRLLSLQQIKTATGVPTNAANLADFGTLANNTTGNAATATLTTNAINSTNLYGLMKGSSITNTDSAKIGGDLHVIGTSSFSAGGAIFDADGSFTARDVTATSGDGFTGIGANLTALSGGNITSGTISSNKMDATAYAAFIGGGSSTAAGNSIQTRTNSGAVIPELTGQTNVWNVLNYGAASYPADSTTAFNAAGTNLTFAGGTMWVPRAIYGITGTVALQGGLASGMPVAAFDYGNYTLRFDKHARIYCDVGTTNAFLFRTAAGQWRKVQIEDGSLNGTNATGALLPTQVGMAFDGPSGGLEVSRMNVQQMGVGYFVDDVTVASFKNIIGVGCNIGFAWGYKPDSVVVQDSTFRNNRWGSWTMFTNAQFTATSSIEGYPTFRNVTFGYNTNAAILHSHGELLIDDGCYFEANGPNTNEFTALQIGMDTSDTYQRSFTNNSPSQGKPRVKINNYSANWKHAIKVYHEKGAEIYMTGAKTLGSTAPVIRLMTSGADNSIIRSDVNDPLWITNSSGTWFSVPMGWMFVSNAIVPISGMASMNLTDSTNIARLNGTNVFTGTNTFTGSVLVTNLILIPSVWSGPTNTLELSGSYKTYATATDVAITNLSGVVAGEVNWATLAVSNSAASAIVVRNTVGATVRLQGTGTTNALTIPAGKVGFMEFFTITHTNLFSTVQQ